jgi:hypothetical protein
MGVWLQRQWVCWPFCLSFIEFITTMGVHNMLALVLELRFKGLKCVIDFLGHDKAKLLVVEYDSKTRSPCL